MSAARYDFDHGDCAAALPGTWSCEWSNTQAVSATAGEQHKLASKKITLVSLSSERLSHNAPVHVQLETAPALAVSRHCHLRAPRRQNSDIDDRTCRKTESACEYLEKMISLGFYLVPVLSSRLGGQFLAD